MTTVEDLDVDRIPKHLLPPRPSQADAWLCAGASTMCALGVGAYLYGRTGDFLLSVIITVMIVVTVTAAGIVPTYLPWVYWSDR